jgi:hypothetical protein
MTGKASRRRYDISTRTSLGRLRRWVVCLLGVAAILPNLMASMAWASHARGVAAFGFGAGQLVVCTEAGSIVVDLRGEPVPQTRGDPDCACCLLLTQGAAHAPDPGGVAFQPPPRSAVVLAYVETAASTAPRSLRAGASPRGPPVA